MLCVVKLGHAESVAMDKAIFDSLTQTGFWFVEHFSPYCHICRDFAPTWKALTEEQGELAQTHDIHFGTIDCSIHGDLCQEHGITGYPSMNLYVDGHFAQSYIGARSKKAILSFLMHQHAKRTANNSKYSTSQSISLDGKSLTHAIQQRKRPYFVKFYVPWCPHCQRLAPLWNQLAKELKDQVDVAQINCDDYGGKEK
ncbi:thioredoxin-like protein [Chlamydoabsidia padenii]|nr:thioredoxin-like protein [Chlamydoabsidia padenii]